MKNKQAYKNLNKLYTGPISINRKGVGFVTHEDFEEDVRIESPLTNTALHRDTVEFEITGKEKGVFLGKVTKVIERSKTTLVGTIEKEGDVFTFKPDDTRIGKKVYISTNTAIKKGQKVLAIITKWGQDDLYVDVTKIIGEAGDNNSEMHSIALGKGFDYEFEDAVLNEVTNIKETLTEEDIKSRLDVRGVTTFTIDPDNAKDFDDALSIEKKEDGLYEIGIHIADVSHYVKEGTALDREARKRAFSVYLVDRTIPMLPEKLSNNLCSLNPNQDRPAFSAIMTMTAQGKVVKRWFGKTIINSNRRFTYEDAQDVLDKKRGEFFEELSILNGIAKKLRAEKFRKGAIDFEKDEIKFKLDETGKPLGVYIKKRLETHKLVEEFMLLANKEVAIFINDIEQKYGQADSALLYRIHDEPNKDKIKNLALFVRNLGYTLPHVGGKIKIKDLQALMNQVEGKAEEGMVKTAAVRSMAKAIYSTKNIGHFGLAFEHYAHFTSPIRRYPDLLVHRLLFKYLNGQKITDAEIRFYESCAVSSSDREIAAAEAERESIKYKQVEYMQNFIGKEFDGVISGVTEWGIYLEENTTKAEGMVRIKDLDGDYYRFDEKNYRLVGERRKKTFALGDPVHFTILKADMENKQLEFKLL